MRIEEIINEAIVVHGPELLAYAITVSEAYEEKPVLDKSVVPVWQLLIQSIQKLMSKVRSKVDVQYTPDDPYRNDREMMADVIKNRRLQIWNGASDTHPVFNPRQNHEFRTVHDFFAH